MAMRVEVGDGLTIGESLGESNALGYVGLKDGRVQCRQSFANGASNNSVYDFTINHYCGFQFFFKDARLVDKVHSLGGRPHVRRRRLHGDKD